MQQFLHNLAEYTQKQYEEAKRYKKTVTDEGLENFYWEAQGRQKAYEDILERISNFIDY